MNLIQRMNVVENPTLTDKVKALRKEYRSMDVYEQEKQLDHYKELCKKQGIDEYLIICDDVHFKYLLKHDLIERF